MNNLSTHTEAAFYEAFPAEKARSLARKIQFIYTPVHGSWLNLAEIELSVLGRPRLKRRLPDTKIFGGRQKPGKRSATGLVRA